MKEAKQERQELNWQLAYSRERDGACSDWMPASVPGCVQLDTAAARGIPLYYTGDHEDEYRWMEPLYWHYRAQAQIEERKRVPFLCLTGVDYEYDLLLNGQQQYHHEGMFTGREVDLSAYKGQTVQIEVIVYPAPKMKDCYPERGMGNEAAHTVKPAFTYGWDWSPRLVTLGMFSDAYVEYRSAARITQFDLSYRLDDTLETAEVRLAYAAAGTGKLQFVLTDAAGAVVLDEAFPAESGEKSFRLQKPELWWPHNHGRQPVYTASLRFLSGGAVTDTHSRRIGFRRSQLVTNENVWFEQMEGELKSCARPPMTLQLNGRRIFAKGSNWVPAEMSPAQLKKDTILTLLTYAKDANMNLLRLWGGAYIQPDWFYDLCDALGIMVWLEFPLACSEYRDDDHYLQILSQEADTIIRRLRMHPCVVLWCGGNELLTDGCRMTPQHKALRLLDAKTYALDPDTPYILSSPQQGVAHGPYDMVCGSGREILTEFTESRFTAYAEFGCAAPSDWDYLATFMTEQERENPMTASVWEKHHAQQTKPWPRWFDMDGLRKLTGCTDDLREMITAGNEAQAMMYQALFEEVRRQWPHASMAINWCYNEPWPTAAGNGLVNYPARPRRSYYGVKEALRGKKLSLGFSRIAWRPGEQMQVTAWVLNDTASSIPDGYAVVLMEADGEERVLGEWRYRQTQPWSNQKGECFTFAVPKTKSGRFGLKIVSKRELELHAEYSFFVHENAV